MRALISFFFCVILSSLLHAQDWQEKYSTIYEEGDVFYYAYEYEKALLKFEEAFKIANDHLGAEEVYRSGFSLAETQRELLLQFEAEQVFKQVLDSVGSNLSNEQNSVLYQYLGLISSATSRYELANSYNDSAISYSILANDTTRIGSNLVNKSIILIYLNEYDEALHQLDQAASLQIETATFNSFLNQTYYNVYSYKNENQKGYPYLLKAYNLAKEANDTDRYLGVLINLSNYHINQNNFREGLAYVNEGYSKSKEIKDLIFIARFSDNLGRIYRSLNEIELAIDYYNEAIKIYEQSENYNLANTLKIQISGLYLSQNEYSVSENILIDLLAQDINSIQKVSVYNYLSDIEKNREDYEEAKRYLEKALAELDSNTQSFSRTIYDRFLSLPIISESEKVEYAKKALKGARVRNDYSTMTAEIDLAGVYESVNQDSAFKYAYSALDRLEKRRYSTSSSSIKSNMNSSWQSFYFEVAKWEVDYNQDYDKAFELFELSKSRTLFDQILENQKAELLNPENPESVRILGLQKRIDQLYQQLGNNNLSSDYQSDMLELSELELEYQTLIDDQMNSNSDFKNLEYPRVSTLGDAKSLLNDETAFLSYGLNEDELLMFLITSEIEVFKTFSLEDDAIETLSSQVNAFRDAIIEIEDFDIIESHSSQLKSIILDPIIDNLDGIKHLVISPDGPLHLLPFDAIILEDQFLAERYSIKYLPSISIFDVIEYPSVNDFEKDLLAMAGSGFESGDNLFGSSSQDAFATLPYSLAEVDSISNYFSNSTVLRNEDVTETTFKNLNLSDYRFIHLATHGNIDERLPDQSGLILSKKTDTEMLFGEDGYLNAREISQLNIFAELVVLSACNTGTGKVITGEGVMGLQRSILAAGASSVIVSLWNIFDRSTPQFMNTFYDQLLEFEDQEISFFDKIKLFADIYEPELIDYKTLALQQAKIEMINHPYYNHPVHWAPFIITGK